MEQLKPTESNSTERLCPHHTLVIIPGAERFPHLVFVEQGAQT